MAISIRAAGANVPSSTIAGLRAALMVAAICVALVCFSNLRRQLQFTKPWQHIFRGLFFGISVYLGFYAITAIPLATSTVLFFTAPIFATILSVWIHGQPIGPRRIAAIIMGFTGALVILRPGVIPLNLGMVSAVLSSVFFSGGLVMSRNLARIDGPISTFTSSTVITLFLSIPLVINDYSLPTQPSTWGWILALSVVSIVRQLADIQAYRLADAAVIAPISYLRLVFIGIAAYLIFNEIPDQPTLIGAGIIIGSAIYIAHRERSA